MQTNSHASVRELAYKIKGFGRLPRFALFLGAGASRQSGVITASEMIRFFKDWIFTHRSPEHLKTNEDKEKWLTEQEWYNTEGSEYGRLFEQYEFKEIGRQRYIESIIEGQEPSFGYVVLANLMASNYINTVVTTNFDDLVYSACTSYTGIRPIVYAYGVLASEMRITAQRPKILKLHGDYLYSALKNTFPEVALQDPNMARQLNQVINEYGLVVIGYSGEDKTVMDILSQISRNNDLYWCVMRGSGLTEPVKELLEKKSGVVVEIEGFDEMMNEIRETVGFDVGKMFGSIQDRQDRMIERLKNFDRRYSADILSETVEALQKQASQEQEQIKKIQALDYFTRGQKAQEDGDLAKAAEFYAKAIEINPHDVAAHNNLGIILAEDPAQYAAAEAAYRKSIEFDPSLAPVYNNLGFLLYKKLRRFSEAEEILNKAVTLDPGNAIAHNNLGNVLWADKGRYTEAEAAYRKSIELAPNYPLPYGNLSILLRLQGRDSEALTSTERWVDLASNSLEPFMELASLHKKLGNKTESDEYLARARELVKPDDWYSVACLEAIAGNTDEAIEKLRRAAQSDSFDAEWVKSDPDLEWIRDDPRFKEIVGLKQE